MAPPPQHHIVTDLRLASPRGLAYFAALAAGLYILWCVVFAIYHLYFRPLSKVPAVKSWTAFPVLKHISHIRGKMDSEIFAAHEKYGDVIRVGPYEVSYTTAQAWNDIYGFNGPSKRQLPKPPRFEKGAIPNIISGNDADHTRFRKAMSHAFSERAMRDQEPIINEYINLLIEKLKGVADSDAKTNIVKWYNLTTFDVIGDLSFGEPFDGLKNSTIHEFIANIFQFFKGAPIIRASHYYPLLAWVLKKVMPRKLIEARAKQNSFAHDTVMRRLNNEKKHGRNDFIDSMMKHRGDKDGLSDAELVSNANILILAGSETTATLLSGVTYWLLKTPKTLQKTTKEIRSQFQKEDDINFISASKNLPYMLACLDEALRLYPPVPTSLPRLTLPGGYTNIAGVECPPGTLVGVHQIAAYWSERNFHDAKAFHPERWLPSATQDPSSAFYSDNRNVVQPFLFGPRNCIGRNLAYNEMRLILARVLWNFELELCEESKNWAFGANQKIHIVWSKPDLNVRLRRRADL